MYMYIYLYVWGYMLKKMQVGSCFFYYFFFYHFFSMQRAYGTLKQNLIKFKYTQVIN